LGRTQVADAHPIGRREEGVGFLPELESLRHQTAGLERRQLASELLGQQFEPPLVFLPELPAAHRLAQERHLDPPASDLPGAERERGPEQPPYPLGALDPRPSRHPPPPTRWHW